MSYITRLVEMQALKVRQSPSAQACEPKKSASDIAYVSAAKEELRAGTEPWKVCRNAMISRLAIPSSWSAGLRSLSDSLPPGMMEEDRWGQILEDVDYIAERWSETAYTCGWSDFDLFGCSRTMGRRLDQDGLALLLEGRKVLALDGGAATIEPNIGPPTRMYRGKLGGVPIWTLSIKRTDESRR